MSETKRRLTAVRLKQQVQCLLRTMNENVGVADCIKGAPFAIVDGHCEASRIAHGFQAVSYTHLTLPTIYSV